METWVHHLCEAVHKRRVLWMNPANIQQATTRMPEIAPLLARLPVYSLREAMFDDALIETAVNHASAVRLNLPYPDMLLELERSGLTDPGTGETGLTDRWIVHAFQQKPGGEIGIELFTTDADPKEWIGGYGMAVVSPEDGHQFNMHASPEGELEADAENALHDAVGLLFSFLRPDDDALRHGRGEGAAPRDEPDALRPGADTRADRPSRVPDAAPP